ncbi:MAG: hypothetical protein HW394_739 [Acidobacteria bacterium]|nr:hypothetical protein [Acidobacteriota bacterium]
MIPTKSPHPLRLQPLRRRLEGWRRTRAHPRSPIPKTLWASAVALARQHGLYHTARALRLDYGALKQHVETADARDRTRPTPAFVEFAGSTLPDLGACAIELTGPRGTVRIRVPGLALADLATLSRTLVGADA